MKAYYNAAESKLVASKLVEEAAICSKLHKDGKSLLTKTEAIKEITKMPKYGKWAAFEAKLASESDGPLTKSIINKSSIIQGNKITPWMPEEGIIQILSDKGFCDPDGLMPLSDSQKRHFAGYRRPREFIELH